MTDDTFSEVVLTRPGIVALLAEDGTRVTVFSEDYPDGAQWRSLLAELHRCGLPSGVDVLDEWVDDQGTWVTLYGQRD